jgi:hypothetical protein
MMATSPLRAIFRKNNGTTLPLLLKMLLKWMVQKTVHSFVASQASAHK